MTAIIPVRVGKGTTVHAMREGENMTLCGMGQGMSNTRAGRPYRWHGDVTCKRCTR